MKLFFQKFGEGKPLLILHGLFGMGDNWATIAKKISGNGYEVFLVDLRNHGRSKHSLQFDYSVMAADVAELMDSEGIRSAAIIGHSMGGKVAMFLAMNHPERVSRLIVADIAPRYYAPHHQHILSAIKAIDVAQLKSRGEAEQEMKKQISDLSTVQFLLKNLYWTDEKNLDWRFGLEGIERNIEEVGRELKPQAPIEVPALFIRGGLSDYINDNDVSAIKSIFPRADVKTIDGAGHWVHAEKPEAFTSLVLEFLG